LGKINRNKEFVSLSNAEIIALTNKLYECKREQQRIENEIKRIQDECNHNYLFVTSEEYDDIFACEFCGHVIKV